MDTALEEAFAAFGRDPETTELAGALLVARLLDPRVDVYAIMDGLETLGAECGSAEPWEHLAACGFRGNAEHYDTLDNSHLGRVLETRRGLPITLAIILVHVARTAEREAVGINFPGHFLVRIDEQLVDPFALRPVTRAECFEWLPAAERRRPTAELFATASAQAVGLRMLNNVKGVLAGRGEWHRALAAADAQLAIAPDQPAVHLERGELWLRMGSVASARLAFEDAFALAVRSGTPGMQALAAHVRRRLDDLPGDDDVLH